MDDETTATEPATKGPAKTRYSPWGRAWGVGILLLAVIGLLAMGYASGPDWPNKVEKIRTLTLKTDPSALTWSPGGKQLAALSNLFTHVKVWNTDT